MQQRYIAVENIVREGEIAWNKQFLLFSQCFLAYMALIFRFECTLKCRQSAICFNLDQSKILSSGNEFMSCSGQDMYLDVFTCMEYVLGHTKITRWDFFQDIFNTATTMLSCPADQSKGKC